MCNVNKSKVVLDADNESALHVFKDFLVIDSTFENPRNSKRKRKIPCHANVKPTLPSNSRYQKINQVPNIKNIVGEEERIVEKKTLSSKEQNLIVLTGNPNSESAYTFLSQCENISSNCEMSDPAMGNLVSHPDESSPVPDSDNGNSVLDPEKVPNLVSQNENSEIICSDKGNQIIDLEHDPTLFSQCEKKSSIIEKTDSNEGISILDPVETTSLSSEGQEKSLTDGEIENNHTNPSCDKIIPNEEKKKSETIGQKNVSIFPPQSKKENSIDVKMEQGNSIQSKKGTDKANSSRDRRNPEKTKRDIEKDKFRKVTQDIVKKLESGLVPPGMETEITEKFSSHKNNQSFPPGPFYLVTENKSDLKGKKRRQSPLRNKGLYRSSPLRMSLSPKPPAYWLSQLSTSPSRRLPPYNRSPNHWQQQTSRSPQRWLQQTSRSPQSRHLTSRSPLRWQHRSSRSPPRWQQRSSHSPQRRQYQTSRTPLSRYHQSFRSPQRRRRQSSRSPLRSQRLSSPKRPCLREEKESVADLKASRRQSAERFIQELIKTSGIHDKSPSPALVPKPSVALNQAPLFPHAPPVLGYSAFNTPPVEMVPPPFPNQQNNMGLFPNTPNVNVHNFALPYNSHFPSYAPNIPPEITIPYFPSEIQQPNQVVFDSTTLPPLIANATTEHIALEESENIGKYNFPKNSKFKKEILNRCVDAVEKLESLHFPNRLFLPSHEFPKTSNEVTAKSSPLRRQKAPTYSFTSKPKDSRTILLPSIISTIGLDQVFSSTALPPPPSTKLMKDAFIQTDEFSCDACVLRKNINCRHKSTMTISNLISVHSQVTDEDLRSSKVTFTPNQAKISQERPVSLMHMTPAQILVAELAAKAKSLQRSTVDAIKSAKQNQMMGYRDTGVASDNQSFTGGMPSHMSDYNTRYVHNTNLQTQGARIEEMGQVDNRQGYGFGDQRQSVNPNESSNLNKAYEDFLKRIQNEKSNPPSRRKHDKKTRYRY